MIEIQILAITGLAAVLTSVPVPLEDVVPGELDFLLRHVVINQQKDDTRQAQSERDCTDGLGVRFLLREILPFGEIVRLEGTIVTVENDLRMSLEKQSQRPTNGAYIHRLPQTIQNQHMLVQHGRHIPIQLVASYTNEVRLSTQVEPGAVLSNRPEVPKRVLQGFNPIADNGAVEVASEVQR